MSRAVPCTQHRSQNQRSIPVGKTPPQRGPWPPSHPSRPAAPTRRSQLAAALLRPQPRGGAAQTPPGKYLALPDPGRPGRPKLRVSSRWEQPSFWHTSHRCSVLSSSSERSQPWGQWDDSRVCEVLGGCCQVPPGHPRTWPGRKCSWVTVAVSLCRPVSSTPGAPYLGGPSKKQRG